jgi:VIT1/CCC1 family predicted Fe2+/Mn2+ transporter
VRAANSALSCRRVAEQADRDGRTEEGEPGESEKERLDRNFQELLQGLRVALPGVQVLFAFLLILPFQQGYVKVTEFQETVYFGTLLCTAIASACLIAPPVRHRLLFRRGVKDWILFNSNKVVTVGFVFLAVAIAGAILLISDFIYDSTAAVVATVVVGLALGWFWFGSPLLELRRDQRASG